MSVRRVLLVFDDCGPGDALRAAFALSAVRTAYPAAGIVVLAGEQAAEIFKSSTIPDRVVTSRLYLPVDRQGVRRRLDKLQEIARLVWELGHGYDLAVTFFWGTLALNVLTFLLARRRIGYLNRFAFLQSTSLAAYDQMGSSTAQNLALLVAAGVRSPQPALEPMTHDESDVVAIRDLLERHALTSERPLVVLHTGSDWACQQWSVGSWAQVADRLIDRYDLDIIWSGDASERGYVDEIRGRMRHRTVSVCGETKTVNQLGVLLSMASLCVSVDSLPYELAVAEAVPVIVLSGPTMPETQLKSRVRSTVINNTGHELRRAIVRCQASFAHGRCHDYSCPMSQLGDIRVEEVLARVAGTGALRRVDALQAARE